MKRWEICKHKLKTSNPLFDAFLSYSRYTENRKVTFFVFFVDHHTNVI